MTSRRLPDPASWCVLLLDPPLLAFHQSEPSTRIVCFDPSTAQPSDPKPSPRRQLRTASRTHPPPINTLDPHLSSYNSIRSSPSISRSTIQIRSSSKSRTRDGAYEADCPQVHRRQGPSEAALLHGSSRPLSTSIALLWRFQRPFPACCCGFDDRLLHMLYCCCGFADACFFLISGGEEVGSDDRRREEASPLQARHRRTP